MYWTYNMLEADAVIWLEANLKYVYAVFVTCLKWEQMWQFHFKIKILWNVMLCGLLISYWHFEGLSSYIFSLQHPSYTAWSWRYRHYTPLKHWYLFTIWHVNSIPEDLNCKQDCWENQKSCNSISGSLYSVSGSRNSVQDMVFGFPWLLQTFYPQIWVAAGNWNHSSYNSNPLLIRTHLFPGIYVSVYQGIPHKGN